MAFRMQKKQVAESIEYYELEKYRWRLDHIGFGSQHQEQQITVGPRSVCKSTIYKRYRQL